MKLATEMTVKKEMMAKIREFLLRIKGPAISVSPTKLVPNGNKKYSFSKPK